MGTYIEGTQARAGDRALYSSGEARALLEANGLDRLGPLFTTGNPVRSQRHLHKEVVRVLLRDRERRTEVPVFVKRQWRRGRLLPRLSDLLSLHPYPSDPVHEWQGLQRLRAVGLLAAEPLALFWCPFSTRSAVVVREVPAPASLRDLLQSGALYALPPKRLDAVTAAIDQTLRRLRQARLGWRSLMAKHIYPEMLPDGSVRLWLIDCEGVYRVRTRRAHQRDEARFLDSVRKADAGEAFAARIERLLEQPEFSLRNTAEAAAGRGACP